VRTLSTLLLGIALAIPVAQPMTAVAQGQEACVLASPTPAPSPDGLLLMPEEIRIALFDAVWGTVDQGYLDPEHNGVDWAAVGEEYAPYFLQTETAVEVYELLEEMIGLLDDEQMGFFSALQVEALAPPQDTYGGIGTLLDTSGTTTDGGSPRVLYVFPGSGASEAGIKPRDRLVSVDGDPCITVAAVRGPEGTTVTLGVETPGEAPRDVVIERRRVETFILPIASRMGPGGSIGYLRLPSVEGAAMVGGIANAMEEFTTDEPISALILDLRSAALGAGGVTSALLGHLVDGEPARLYTRAETQPMPLPDSPYREALADLPIVVLVDDVTAGEAERVAMVLQAAGRGQVIGEETAGLTRWITELPLGDGSLLHLVTSGIELADGTRPDRDGITPDIPLEGDWLSYPEAEDPWIVAALELLEGAGSTGRTLAPSDGGRPVPSEAPSPSASAATPVPSAAPTTEPSATAGS
jgi:carboxyl-terminal processing protease